ncbi:MAG TPA: DUF1254 domain-containing protein [Chthoniobacterales bacterium]|nr:DUF1254 domain-containing protein [Chthoniobacterales bacterium]
MKKSTRPTLRPNEPIIDWQERYAKSLGFQAYVYGFPWIYLSFLRWLWTTPGGKKLGAKSGQKVSAPINFFFNAQQTATPANATGGSPNPNLLYSVAWLDLGPEPIVLHVPEITDRYYCMQMVCMDSDNFAYVGTYATGTAAGDYLIAGPGWAGKVPEGVQDVLPRSRTPVVLIFGRTKVKSGDTADLKLANEIQAQYGLTPLSDWPVFPPTNPLPPLKRDPHEFLNPTENWEGAWLEMNRAMEENPPGVPPGIDQSELLRLFATVGVGPGQSWFDQSEATKKGLAEAAHEGLKFLPEMAQGRGKTVRYWTFPPNYIGRSGQHSDFITRAAVQALAGIAAHDACQAVYINTALDCTGARLVPETKYMISFGENDFPAFDPTYHGYWSLTLYQVPGYNLVSGATNYTVSSDDPTKSDGTMVIYLQNENPLPLPTGEYWLQTPDPNNPDNKDITGLYLLLRVYVPGPDVWYTQTWLPPEIVPQVTTTP